MEIICPYCQHQVSVPDPGAADLMCPDCFSPLQQNQLEEVIIEAEEKGPPDFLRFVYQTNGEYFLVSCRDPFVLGREHSGQEMLATISQISRRHCKIEPRGDYFVVTDLGSLNGTFMGAAKIDCRKYPAQKLVDKELLFLGKEAFLVVYQYEDKKAGSVSVEIDMSAKKVEAEIPTIEKTSFECQHCRSYTSDTREFTCPECHTYNC